MKLWVKICGLTSEAGLAAAIEAGADAVGFVFARSKRQVTPQRAAELARGVAIPRVAVMQHPSQALLDEVWEVFRPDVLQTDAEDLQGLIVPGGLKVTPVVRSGRVPHELPRRVLFEGPASGTGTTTDWSEAADIARRIELILAGGLDAGNVADAIRRVGPFGVDVSSGVEGSAGVKDPKKIHQFVRAAREAAESER